MSYTGTDNLEIMQDAVNYNRYLVESILKYANPSDRILDFGAGIGLFAKAIVERGYQVLCLETDEKQIALIQEAGLNVNSDLLNIENESLDYIYSLNVLEHIEDDAAALRMLYSKMKPGGKLFLYVPAFQILFSSMDVKVGHYRRYHRKQLANIVQSAGFNVLKSRYADSAGFFATLLFKIMGNNSGALNHRALKMYDRMIFPLSRMMDKLLGLTIGKNVMLIAEKN